MVISFVTTYVSVTIIATCMKFNVTLVDQCGPSFRFQKSHLKLLKNEHLQNVLVEEYYKSIFFIHKTFLVGNMKLFLEYGHSW